MKVKGLLVLMVVVGVGLFMFAGCSKDEPAASSTTAHDEHDGHDHAAHTEEATAKFVNSKCPIMGNVINPEKVTESLIKEYKDQKVAFCCAGCPEKWDALSDEDKAAKLLAAK